MYKPRILFEKIKPYFYTPEAIVITGMRRTGKTTLIWWFPCDSGLVNYFAKRGKGSLFENNVFQNLIIISPDTGDTSKS